MRRRIRPTALLTVLTIGGAVFLAARPAQAQRNTYADFPYNQGSLFYRYIPPSKPKPKPVRRPVVRPYTAPPQAGYTYAQPNGYAPQRQYYYNPQTNSYYYYPTTPAPVQAAPVAPRTVAPTYGAQPAAPR
jgi:hypothetical protein